MAQLIDLSLIPALDADGVAVSGAELRFFASGTSTPAPVYTTDALNVAHPVPLLSNAAGRFPPVYTSGLTELRATLTIGGTVVRDVDPIVTPLTASDIRTSDNITVQQALDRIQSVTFNAVDYGVLANNVADDTAALNAAINAAEAAGGGTIILPPGVIRTTGISRTVSPGLPWILQGSGKKATTIRKLGTTTVPVVKIDGAPNLDWAGGLRDLNIDGTNVVGVNALELSNIARMVTDRVECVKADIGFEIRGGLILNFNDCSALDCGTGFRTRRFTPSGPFANLIYWNGGDVRAAKAWGFDLGQGTGLQLRGVDISANGTAGNLSTGGIILRDTLDDETGLANVTLSQCYLEVNKGWALKTEGAGGLRLRLDGCEWYANEAGRDIDIGAIGFAHLSDCMTAQTTNIAAARSKITGGLHATLNDTSVRRIHEQVATSGVDITFNVMNGAIRADLNSVGFYGTSPIVRPAVGAAATDAATTQTLANNLRTALINLGLVQN